MTNTEKKLIAALLDLASEKFSNHGCNDFDLAEIVPDVEERRAIAREYYEHNNEPEEFNPDNKYESFEDWILMDHFAGKLRGEAESDHE